MAVVRRPGPETRPGSGRTGARGRWPRRARAAIRNGTYTNWVSGARHSLRQHNLTRAVGARFRPPKSSIPRRKRQPESQSSAFWAGVNETVRRPPHTVLTVARTERMLARHARTGRKDSRTRGTAVCRAASEGGACRPESQGESADQRVARANFCDTVRLQPGADEVTARDQRLHRERRLHEPH